MNLRILYDDLANLGDAGLEVQFADSGRADRPEIIRLSTLMNALDRPATIPDLLQPAEHKGSILYVTTDAGLGARASKAGGRRVQHEVLLGAISAKTSARFHYVQITVVPSDLAKAFETLRAVGAVLVHRTAAGELLGIAEERAVDGLVLSGLSITKLGPPGLPDSHDLYLMRDADASPAGFADEAAARFADRQAEVLASISEGLVVAIPSSASIEDFHFPVTRHGHNLKLLADPALMRSGELGFAGLAVPVPSREAAAAIAGLITADRMEGIVQRLSGAVPVDGSPIASRHVHHPDCDRAVVEIVRQLTDLGLSPVRHQFVHEGRVLANIVADVEGTGEELVLVTAHLDSRAGRDEPDYRPDRDSAPGADDDASGVAAVVAIAAAAVELARTGRPQRGLRFALFHAEEHGLVGSRHYARAAAEAALPIMAVLQMDMIGFLPGGPGARRVEVHIGHRADPAVERRSEPIALLLEKSAHLLGELGEVEIYRSPQDATIPGDPADGRSDHSSFHMSGFAAVIVSEDFFGGTVDDPTPNPNNPQYHSRTDTSIDAAYAAAIARTVGLAAWTLAANSS